jgi:hypothetical protein
MEQQLEEICKRAIPLPECPVKKQDAIARRIWLKKEIKKLLTNEPAANTERLY